MDFTNEPYVRLFTRDTLTWKRFNWQAKATLPLLLRKVDRSGTMDMAGMDAIEAVSTASELPPEVIQEALPVLFKLGVIEVRAGTLFVPRFLEAQECIKSDKLRAREYRKRRSQSRHGNHGVDDNPEEEPSRNVTTVTKSDHSVTRNHGANETSRGVTLGLASLPLASPASASLPLASPASASPASADQLLADRAAVLRHAPASSRQAQYQGLGLGKASKLEQLTKEQRQTLQVVAEASQTKPEHWQGTKPSWIDLVASAGRDEASKVSGIDPEEGIRRIVRKWLADPYVQNNAVSLGHLANNPAPYMTKVALAHNAVSQQTIARREADAAKLRREISTSLLGQAVAR